MAARKEIVERMLMMGRFDDLEKSMCMLRDLCFGKREVVRDRSEWRPQTIRCKEIRDKEMLSRRYDNVE